MAGFLERLSSRRRFGMKPGLDTIAALCAALGDPQRNFPAIHIAGTNGKGAVAAICDSVLRAAGLRLGRYTSPHLFALNERFCLDGHPVDDETLQRLAARVEAVVQQSADPRLAETTFFEALTVVALLLYAERGIDYAVLETGLGGRLDATNICLPQLTVITRIGLDHCDWLGSTVEAIAAEKAGIIKPGVPIVLGANEPSVCEVIRRAAERVGAPFHYAPDLAREEELPAGYALQGSFNRENAVTALAALRVLATARPELPLADDRVLAQGFVSVVWPGRFQRIGGYLLDGAHNPPAARALAAALAATGVPPRSLTLLAGFCGDKDVDAVLDQLVPYAARAFAVRTNNPRSLAPEELAARLRERGLATTACESLAEALSQLPPELATDSTQAPPQVLICGSLFLTGEALVALHGLPWRTDRFDRSEQLVATEQEAPS